ncbi:MAG: VPLPA-CTERM sorting domain-containing protein [Pseudomonadota bacterium]
MRLTLGLAALALCASPVAHAASVDYFTDRAAFEAAAGDDIQTETFNSATTDTGFSGGTAYFAPFTFAADATFIFFANKIDATPQVPEAVNDGSTVVSFYIDTAGTGRNASITFDNPVYSFGGDFTSINDTNDIDTGGIRTRIDLAGQSTTPVTAPINTTRFLGFVSDTPFTVVSFTALDADTFSLDNVSYSESAPGGAGGPAPVPLPAGAALLLSGLAVLVARRTQAI